MRQILKTTNLSELGISDICCDNVTTVLYVLRPKNCSSIQNFKFFVFCTLKKPEHVVALSFLRWCWDAKPIWMLQHHGGIYFTNASHVTAAYFTICNMSMQFCVIYNLFSNVLAIVSPRHNFFSPCVSKSPTTPLSEPCEIQIFSGVGRVGIIG